MKTIKIACDVRDFVDLDELVEIQGELKTLPDENYQRLKGAILKTGLAFPIKVWVDADGQKNIVGGTQTTRTLRRIRDEGLARIPKIPVVKVHADDLPGAKERVLQDASLFGKVNEDGLAAFLQGSGLNIAELMQGIDLPDLDMGEFLEKHFPEEKQKVEFEARKGVTGVDEDDVPSTVKARAKLGDVFVLGDHRLMCGDATDTKQVSKLLKDGSVDMVFTDPPYGIQVGVKIAVADGKQYGKSLAKSNKFKPILNDDSTDVAIRAYHVCADLGVPLLIFWGGNYYADSLPPSSCWIVWDKENGDTDFADAELAWTNSKSAVRICRHMWNGMIKASEHGERRIHPTQKPIALAEWCFDTYGKNAKTVLDLFGGSGSTLIACEKTHRTCFMMELDPYFVDVIVARWEKYTGKKAQLFRDGQTVKRRKK